MQIFPPFHSVTDGGGGRGWEGCSSYYSNHESRNENFSPPSKSSRPQRLNGGVELPLCRDFGLGEGPPHSGWVRFALPPRKGRGVNVWLLVRGASPEREVRPGLPVAGETSGANARWGRGRDFKGQHFVVKARGKKEIVARRFHGVFSRERGSAKIVGVGGEFAFQGKETKPPHV